MGGAGAPLVGREAETGALAAALADAADGPVLALLLGAPGLGKTRLAAELAGRAVEEGTRVLRGSCPRLSAAGASWAPWTQALRGLLRREGRDVVEALAGPAAARALAPLLPLTGGGGAPVPPAHALEALLALVEALAEQRPLLVVLEDLHWSDPLSLDALGFLVRNLAPLPVLLLATGRPAGDAPWEAALPDLLREPDARCVQLAPLTAEQTAELAGALGLDADPALHALSGGNPFHVAQLAQASTARDPAAAVLRRLLGAHPLAREVLELLAVAPVPVPQDALERATGATKSAVGAVLRDLADRALALPAPDGHLPAHALVAEAVLGALLPGERAARARALAVALSGDPERLPLPRLLALAALADAGGAAELEALLPVLVRRAVQEGAPAAALTWGRRALGVRCAERGGLLALVAEAAIAVGEPREAVALLEQSLREPDAEDPGTSGLRLARLAHAQWRCGNAPGSLRTGERAVRLLPPEPSSARARVLASRASALMLLGRADEAEQAADLAVRVAEEAGALDVAAHALGTRAVVHSGEARHPGAVEDLEAALVLAREAGDVPLLLRTLLNGVLVAEASGELGRAVALALEAQEVVRRHGLGLDAERAARTNAVWALHAAGRWAEADALLAPAPLGDVAADRYALLEARARAALAVERGEELPPAVLERWPADDEPHVGLPRLLLLATQQLWRGEPVAALETASSGTCGAGSALDRGRLVVVAVRAVADAVLMPPAVGGARPSAVQQLRARLPGLLAALPDGTGELAALRLTAHAEAARAVGEVADWSPVVAAWDATGRRYDAARARLRLAEAAAPGPAAAALRQAHAVAVALRAEPLRRELASLALRRRLDLDEEPPPPAPPDALAALALTPRERQVLQQLAVGASNRAISRALFITEKTASVHVSNLLGKLGVRSRAEATAVAHRLGLAPVERRSG